MTAADRRDLRWLLATLEDWLLVAEPATVQELGRFLQSIGSTARPSDVIASLGRLRTVVRQLPPKYERCRFNG